MPRVLNQKLPLEGLFGLIKPSGPPSMVLLDRIKPLLYESPLFVTEEEGRKKNRDIRLRGAKKGRGNKRRHKQNECVKVGQGGTLDPLADGVLVVGLNKGTKSLSQFLNCAKEYYTTAILGCETDTYDSEGAVVRQAPFTHVTPEKIIAALAAFRGSIKQLPPIYSALKMDGKPLYEYARSGTPLPRPIEVRQSMVHDIELVGWQEAADDALSGHTYLWPSSQISEAQSASLKSVEELILAASNTASPDAAEDPIAPFTLAPVSPSSSIPGRAPSGASDAEIGITSPAPKPPVFTLRMMVSSGTYVRSIIHDLAHSIGSSAHVVRLTRTRQGHFTVGNNYFRIPGPLQSIKSQANAQTDGADVASSSMQPGGDCNCIPWEPFEEALKGQEAASSSMERKSEESMQEWEIEILNKLHPVSE